MRQVVSPAARRVAREHGVDLTTITGQRACAAVSPSPTSSARSLGVGAAAEHSAGRVKRSVRCGRAITANIVASWRAIPHIHISGELDCDGLAQAREIAAQRTGVKITATDLLLLAMAQALTDVPALNGTVGHDGTPSHARTIDISLAVATAGWRRRADAPGRRRRSTSPASPSARALVEAARAGTLEPRDLGGGHVHAVQPRRAIPSTSSHRSSPDRRSRPWPPDASRQQPVADRRRGRRRAPHDRQRCDRPSRRGRRGGRPLARRVRATDRRASRAPDTTREEDR